ncbi:MarR family winged helix-turn-helix transcriptional regulator [Gemmobacter fulva]|nr:MarR family winged helix-turn-helix transcriptional regulator [Gemmobacter fulvus]
MQTLCGGFAPSVNYLAQALGRSYRERMEQPAETYVLDDQVGYVLRRVTQRHLSIFSEHIPDVTAIQFAVMARLAAMGPLSQNQLGRAASMDAATVKGVVERLEALGHVQRSADPADKRRLTVALTVAGTALVTRLFPVGLRVSAATLAPLDPDEQTELMRLLAKLV